MAKPPENGCARRELAFGYHAGTCLLQIMPAFAGLFMFFCKFLAADCSVKRLCLASMSSGWMKNMKFHMLENMVFAARLQVGACEKVHMDAGTPSEKR